MSIANRRAPSAKEDDMSTIKDAVINAEDALTAAGHDEYTPGEGLTRHGAPVLN